MNKIITTILLAFGLSFSAICQDSLFTPLPYNYLSSKGTLDVTTDGKTRSVTFNLRMKKDSIIWFTLSPAMNVVAFRGIITADSIIIVNMLNKEYSRLPIKNMQDVVGVPFSFGQMQALLVGDVCLNPNKCQISPDKKTLTLDTNGRTFVNNIAPNLRVDAASMVDNMMGDSVSVKYSQFKPVADVPFSYNLVVYLLKYYDDGEQESTFSILHEKVDITADKLTFPFNVPASYKRK